MTPQELFLYLTQTRHFTEDVAQEVVIDYLEGKMDGAKSLKAWASRRAKWRTLDAVRRSHGKSHVELSPTLRMTSPTPEAQAERRQLIDQYQAAHPDWDPLDARASGRRWRLTPP